MVEEAPFEARGTNLEAPVRSIADLIANDLLDHTADSYGHNGKGPFQEQELLGMVPYGIL